MTQRKPLTRRFTADLRMWRHSGIGRYLRNVVPLLLPQLDCAQIRLIGRRELIDAGSPLDILLQNDTRIEFREEPAPIYSIAEQGYPFRGVYNETDLLWVPHYNAPLWSPVPLVVTIHDIAPLALPELLGSPLKRAYARLLIERATSQAAAIMTISDFTRTELMTRLHLPAHKIHLAALGLDADWPSSALPHCEPDGTPYVLFIGNVKPNKNLSVLLTAFRRVMDKVPFRLLIAGRITGLGTADEAVLNDARSFGDRVRMTGEISEAELHSLYAGAEALCLPSTYEGFGLPLFEAMALGCPVLCSNAASLPEVGGDAALYFAPNAPGQLGNCLLQVMDKQQMDALRIRGRARITDFSFTRCATETAGVMNGILSGTIRPPQSCHPERSRRTP